MNDKYRFRIVNYMDQICVQEFVDNKWVTYKTYGEWSSFDTDFKSVRNAENFIDREIERKKRVAIESAKILELKRRGVVVIKEYP